METIQSGSFEVFWECEGASSFRSQYYRLESSRLTQPPIFTNLWRLNICILEIKGKENQIMKKWLAPFGDSVPIWRVGKKSQRHSSIINPWFSLSVWKNLLGDSQKNWFAPNPRFLGKTKSLKISGRLQYIYRNPTHFRPFLRLSQRLLYCIDITQCT